MSEKRELSELQKALLPILEWYHNFCVENGLRYYVVGGTALGAARHQGFIPWDDDIDVGMPRSDYEKFIELCGDRKIGDFYIESINTKNKDFLYLFCKVYDTRTTLVENKRRDVKRGIYLDVFPLDGAGNTIDEAKETFGPIGKRKNLLGMKTYAWRKGRKLHKNMGVIMGRMIPEFILSSKKLILNIDALCKKKNYDECELVCNYYGAWGMKEMVPREVFGTPTVYKFETIEAYGPEKPDEYLTYVYGDWRKLPPKEKQITHHDYVYLDLNEPYM